MFFDEITRLAVSRAIASGLPFVAFVKPGEDKLVFFSDPGSDCPFIGSLSFAVNVWCGGSADEYVIRQCADAAETLAYLDDANRLFPIMSPWHESTDKSDYLDRTDELIGRLRSHGGKTVMSRTICGEGDVDWVEVAEAYFELHPEAFRYLYQTPDHGCWLGASPELLVKVADGRFTTMALAGTRLLSESGDSWSGKNMAEHAVVRGYILERLYDLGLNPHACPTETITTGNIQHLRTIIGGEDEGVAAHDIIRSLNPTPALAGYPLHSALENIAEFEKHPRRCYGSYLALCSPSETEAYVNLRCVNFDSSSWCMYVGGGIMPDSDCDSEWNETEAKSKILYKLIGDFLR